MTFPVRAIRWYAGVAVIVIRYDPGAGHKLDRPLTLIETVHKPITLHRTPGNIALDVRQPDLLTLLHQP
jgi:hypothetical protein